MRNIVKASLSTVALGAALVFAGSASAGIANTKHNLGSTGGAASADNPNKTSATGEICIFCHTPHGGDNTAPVPLWNKRLTDSNFATYDQLGTSTLDAGILQIGSVSLACLTCHDGTQALDNILNGPGSGDYDADGDEVNADEGRVWAWSSFDNSLDGAGRFVSTAIFNLGTDLTNDHPVSVQYGGGGIVDGGGTTNDEDFVQPVQVPGIARWYVNNTNATVQQAGFDKWDFKLYTRNPSDAGETFQNTPTSNATGAQPFVECGSCHDPHFETTTFLRMPGTPDGATESNAGSQVCLACHTK